MLPFRVVGFRFTVGTGQGPRLPRATPVICCAHSVPSSVAQHARRGPRARRGGSRCIINSGEVPGSKIMFLSVHSPAAAQHHCQPRVQAANCLPNCPVSGTEGRLYTALYKYTDRLDLPRHAGRTIASGRSVAGPNLGPATAKAISTSTEKHGSHGRRVSSLESQVSTRTPGTSGEDAQDTTLRAAGIARYLQDWMRTSALLTHPHQTEAIQNPRRPWLRGALGG